jgi:spermidine/putrescine transport system permease protein
MHSRRAAYLLIVPTAAIFTGLFVAPFVYFFVISFWSVANYRMVPGFTLNNYVRTFAEHTDSLVLTLGLAFAIGLLTTALGFVYAYLIRFKAGRWGPLLLFIAMVTLFGGYLMKIYAWKTILGNQGALNTALMSLGIIHEPITALFYTPGAVVVTLVHFLLPLAVLPIYSSLRGVSEIELEAARDLGASPWAVMSDIVLPRCRPGLTAAFVLCFLVSAGDYVTPLLVGGTITMIGTLIVPQFGNFFNWPLGSAMSFTVLFLALLLILASNALAARWQPR